MADIHGNDVALWAVLDNAANCHVDRWWVLGDLVLLGPRPAEVLGLLRPLPGLGMLRGNTDRYVLTGEQSAPHATAADAAGDVGLAERYGLMAAGIGWTRGVLCQTGLLDTLVGLPGELRLRLPGGTCALGVHASPGSDGPGIEPGIPDEQLSSLLEGCAAGVVVGGHTHIAADRLVGGIQALNPGSTGIPKRPGEASWLLLDVDAVTRDLRARLHPNAEFLETILTGKRQQYRNGR
jgi:predicted phosphodiesterase